MFPIGIKVHPWGQVHPLSHHYSHREHDLTRFGLLIFARSFTLASKYQPGILTILRKAII
jgi:hypothetical protein